MNRTLGDDATVEQVLERAIFKAGLITEANFGSFRSASYVGGPRFSLFCFILRSFR